MSGLLFELVERLLFFSWLIFEDVYIDYILLCFYLDNVTDIPFDLLLFLNTYFYASIISEFISSIENNFIKIIYELFYY